MKLSLNWIKEYIDLPEISNEQLAYDLTMSTVEVESMTSTTKDYEHMVLGEILEVSPHPDADKLRVTKVNLGDEAVQIVCGGKNLRIGQKVAVALPGSQVRWHGEGDLVPIKASKLRGVDSYGMIMASNEMGLEGLYPAEDGEIMDLTALSYPPGTALSKALDLEDTIIEIDNKSLTNRPDLWGHYGIARELSAIYNVDLKPLCPGAVLPEEEGIEVEILDESLCRRFNALHIKNVYEKDAPSWMKRRLTLCDITPKNAVVDITNYVLLATGQPSHAFDYSHVHEKIVVRPAREAEELLLLNDETLTLNPSNLVISDGKSALSLAGIMGGKRDSITEETCEVLLEVANFDAMSIRRTSKAYGVRSESSSRFEKGLDTQRVDEALELSVLLFQQIFPEALMVSMTEKYPEKTEPSEVELDLDILEKKIGKSLDKETITGILERLGFSASIRGGRLFTKAPTWRSTGDISLPEDIIEEIARILGYETFETVEPMLAMSGALPQNPEELDRKLREYLASEGLQEIVTYPWVSDTFVKTVGASSDYLELENPPAPDRAKLRDSLVPSMLEAIDVNLPNFNQFALFEVANVFTPILQEKFDENEKLPVQEKELCFSMVGDKGEDLFFTMKGILEGLSRGIMVEELNFKQVEKPNYLDKFVWINILYQEEVLGSFGLLNQQVKKLSGFKRGEVLLGTLKMKALRALPSRDNKHEPLSQLPLIQYDLSIIFDEEVKWSEIKEVVEPVVKKLEFLDEYRGEKLGEHKKSLSFRLWFESKEKMLTSEEVEKKVQYILSELEKNFNLTLRDH